MINWPIVLRYDIKAKYRLISRKFFGHEVFPPERSLNQPKATRVCIRSINQSNRSTSVRFFFSCFVYAFSCQGHTKIALSFHVGTKSYPVLCRHNQGEQYHTSPLRQLGSLQLYLRVFWMFLPWANWFLYRHQRSQFWTMRA